MLSKCEPEHRFAGAFDPDKYRIHESDDAYRKCECGSPLTRTAYSFEGRDHCLGCALDAAGIEKKVLL
ncbi:hypothetical protein GXP70_12295 [Paenibacillus lycopersici]|uniref:Uncharacterized protein n=1 Tax=Paenibacillus lycopersici TaxID=2704462 RepID=A0A6C0FX67_9BACL|nr:hypothetical protein [Paenibacillus lycopersici]QHT60642.1 hypothetical protein GXP70_12295 [Paenibacillus lycopersici]